MGKADIKKMNSIFSTLISCSVRQEDKKTSMLANCYKLMEESEKQYTAGKCEYSEAFNYDDQSSRIDYADEV